VPFGRIVRPPLARESESRVEPGCCSGRPIARRKVKRARRIRTRSTRSRARLLCLPKRRSGSARHSRSHRGRLGVRRSPSLLLLSPVSQAAAGPSPSFLEPRRCRIRSEATLSHAWSPSTRRNQARASRLVADPFSQRKGNRQARHERTPRPLAVPQRGHREGQEPTTRTGSQGTTRREPHPRLRQRPPAAEQVPG
jgi:hypothetical protein